MEVNILNEREQVYRSSDAPKPIKKITELTEREVVYYKSSDPKADCDNFVDMYEEDYIVEEDIGINIPNVAKCPSKCNSQSNGIETDPVFSKSPAVQITNQDIENWNSKQNLLVSGEDIKTINNESLLGPGNIMIEGGGVTEEYVQDAIGQTLAQFSEDIAADILNLQADIYTNVLAIEGKQDSLIDGENIKTINGQSVLGEGNLKIDIPEIDISEIDAKLEIMQKTIGTHNKEVRFFGIEPVTVKVGDVEHYCEANQVSTVFVGDEDFEIIPTSNNSIQSLLGYPIPLKWFDWLEGVEVFDSIVFDMNELSTYHHWIQYYQGDYHVQKAQYSNCVFWSDKPYIHSPFEERTNYTIYYSSQLPLCYSQIPENTYKPFYLSYGVNSDPNWRNPDYVNSYSLVSGATQTFSYYGATAIGIFDMAVDVITLPKDCRGLMYHAPAIIHAGVFDATKTTNFGAKKGSWQEAFGGCISLTSLYIQNLKTSINISWSPINADSIEFIVNNAINTSTITISVSPYTWNIISDELIATAKAKNINIVLLEGNMPNDKRWDKLSNSVTNNTTDLNNIKQGTLVVSKTYSDQNGNNIYHTYATKASVNNISSDILTLQSKIVPVTVEADGLMPKSMLGTNVATKELGNYVEIKHNHNESYLLIPKATSEIAGVMSPEDKKIVDSVPDRDTQLSEQIQSVESDIKTIISDTIDDVEKDYSKKSNTLRHITLSSSATANSLSLLLEGEYDDSVQGSHLLGSHNIILPNATENNAGMMTSEDKFKLNNININSPIAYAVYADTSTDVEVTTISGYFPTELVAGARVTIKITGSIGLIKTLNVNDTGAKNVYYSGNSMTSGTIDRYNVYDFIFDGTYYRILGVDTDNNTHYNAKIVAGASNTSKTNDNAENGNVYLNVVENSTVRSSNNIVGEGDISVRSDATGKIIIESRVEGIDVTVLFSGGGSGLLGNISDFITKKLYTKDSNGNLTYPVTFYPKGDSEDNIDVTLGYLYREHVTQVSGNISTKKYIATIRQNGDYIVCDAVDSRTSTL